MNDVFTVLWKETKDVVLQGGRAALLRPAILLVVFGILLPLQAKQAWYQLPATILFSEIWGPVFVSLTIIADAFAGERERHTLESLLATPVGDQALLLGKMGLAISYGMTIMILDLAVGIVVANRVGDTGAIVFYPSGLLIAALVLGLAANTLASAAGVLVSLRSSTVRQAQQLVTVGAMVVLFGGITLSQTVASHLHWSMSETHLLWLIASAVLLVDIVLVSATFVLFKRSRLILA